MDEFELVADEFTEADQGDLVGFSCGDSMSGRLCTEWISAAGSEGVAVLASNYESFDLKLPPIEQ